MKIAALENLRVGQIGVHLQHSTDFLIDRPLGSGDFLLLYFESPTQAKDATGLHQLEAGTCLLYPPGMLHWYRGAATVFSNSYMHFRASHFNLFPTGQAFTPTHSEFLAPLLTEITHEQTNHQPHSADLILVLATQLLLLVARAHPTQSGGASPLHHGEINAEFSALRAEIRARPQAPWRVQTMARRLHLSTSRFSVLYRAQFGVPPMEDVIEARLAKARYLLLGRGVAVSLVARECGFASPFYFSRLFKAKTGVAPRDYYQARITTQSVLE